MFFEAIARKVENFGDAFFTLNWADNFYLSGISSTFGISVVLKTGECFFFTDKRYIGRKKEAKKGIIVKEWNGWENLVDFLKSLKVKTLVVDGDRISAEKFLNLQKSGIEVFNSQGFLWEFRKIKSEEEISRISQAVLIVKTAIKKVAHLIKPGVTEKEIKGRLIYEALKLGGEKESFDIIVSTGKNSAIPHWKSGDSEIKEGDSVIVDAGIVFKGYVSDITRTFLVGKVSSELKKIYDLVLTAKERAVELLKSSVPARKIDLEVRKVFRRAGYENFFLHSTGHGIGIEIHEPPVISSKSREILCKGMTVTVEPGIYIEGLGGVRIEDDYLVLDDGCEEL